MLDKEGRPIIANPLVGIVALIIVIVSYVVLVPFDFVFKDDNGVIYTQRRVSVISDFEKNAEETEGGEVVYGDGAPVYYYGDGKEKIAFADSYGDLRWEMALLAAKNLVTLNWDRESFTIEMYARQD